MRGHPGEQRLGETQEPRALAHSKADQRPVVALRAVLLATVLGFEVACVSAPLARASP